MIDVTRVLQVKACKIILHPEKKEFKGIFIWFLFSSVFSLTSRRGGDQRRQGHRHLFMEEPILDRVVSEILHSTNSTNQIVIPEASEDR